ncbi:MULTISPECIES: hypothetical protein [unclassified Paenibacillus]|uniref:hypothetical protein n=1 Tax=unclassified Paenibacillus TaxID=185978 RepID=UPI0024748E16|nr:MULTISPECIES: hypothetical protein [unclassified Paenibacillus]MDH6430288.1 hypothetical protein [Paenibacillus sp. PastH-4]MDH6446503.1 hypothetical protein [Paenibacillus sp. PastF-4]MDH6530031.1 hypothetical protein [Paenibacillus sp. PastH-3]
MAIIQPKVFVELDPLDPVAEICAVMMALIPYQPNHEEKILIGVGKAIEDRLQDLRKEVKAHGESLRKSNRKSENQ